MNKDMNMERLQNEIERLENVILESRRGESALKASSFSYWLYERKVQEWQKKKKTEENSKLRLESIIRQAKINLSDSGEDEKARKTAIGVRSRAEELLAFMDHLPSNR